MDLSTTLQQVKELTIDDRIWLVQAIWDSISAESRRFTTNISGKYPASLFSGLTIAWLGMKYGKSIN